jgi:hypothetical protein
MALLFEPKGLCLGGGGAEVLGDERFRSIRDEIGVRGDYIIVS